VLRVHAAQIMYACDRIAAYYAPDGNASFPQPFWELLFGFAVDFIPVAIVVWVSDGYHTTFNTPLSLSKMLISSMSHKWVWAVWEILATLTFLSGFASGNVVTMVVGAVVACGFASLYLASYVKSDHMVKRALEVIFMLSAFGLVIYGYAITRSLLLGVIAAFILTVVFVAFLLSYLLPRIRSKSRNAGADVNEKGDLAYDVGRELGREMREELEENWKSHVLAAVLAMGCGLPIILLKSPWYITILMVFISYQTADYALSKLSKKSECK
jgi:hypothetical protein